MAKHLKDELFDHEYDGIQEYDNRMPNWWLWLLYGTIVFSFLYWGIVHTFDKGTLPLKAYRAEVAKAAAEQLARMEGMEISDESLVLVSQIPDRVEAGSRIWTQSCVECHLTDGSGSIGPNLTDRYWLHGGKPLQIYTTITNGVPEKGMVAWGETMSPTKIQDVTAFLISSIKGKQLPGKDPQGEPEEG